MIYSKNYWTDKKLISNNDFQTQRSLKVKISVSLKNYGETAFVSEKLYKEQEFLVKESGQSIYPEVSTKIAVLVNFAIFKVLSHWTGV